MALRRQTLVLRRSQRRREVSGGQLEEGVSQAEPASPGGGQPACKDGGDVTIDGVARNEAWARRAGAVADIGLLVGEEPRWEGRLCTPFCFARPSGARTCQTRRALMLQHMWVSAVAISYGCDRSIPKNMTLKSPSPKILLCPRISLGFIKQ